jgi:hypothetical protein
MLPILYRISIVIASKTRYGAIAWESRNKQYIEN